MSALNGYNNYKSKVLPEIKSKLDGIEKGQSPKTLFITCSDSRIMPNQMTDTVHGELFVIRNAGNSIPSASQAEAAQDADAATLEYAVKALAVEEIIVCGHSHCGAMGALKSGVDDSLKFIQKYLGRFDELKLKSADWSVDQLIVENIKAQIENIKSYDFVASAVADNKLRVSGWLYHLENGEAEIIELGECHEI